MSVEQFLNQQILELRDQRASLNARIAELENQVLETAKEAMQDGGDRAKTALDAASEITSSIYRMREALQKIASQGYLSTHTSRTDLLKILDERTMLAEEALKQTCDDSSK